MPTMWPGSQQRFPVSLESALEGVLHGVTMTVMSGDVQVTRASTGCTLSVPGGAPLDRALTLIQKTVDYLRHDRYQIALRINTGGKAGSSTQLTTVNAVRAWLASDEGRKCRSSSTTKWTIVVIRPSW